MDITLQQLVFYVVAILMSVFSVMTVTSGSILRSATYLLFVLFGTAAIYFILGYTFLGAVQLMVYAGGIVVLYVFSILLTSKPGDKAEMLTSKKRGLGLIAAIFGVAVCGFALVSYFAANGATVYNTMMTLDMERIGHALLGTEKFQYLLPFEAISVLLLACIIGGITIARKR